MREYKVNFDLEILNKGEIKLTSTIINDIDVLSMSKEKVKYNDNQFFLLEFFVDVLQGNEIDEKSIERFCDIIIRENPYMRTRENLPSIECVEIWPYSNSSNIQAYYKPKDNKITIDIYNFRKEIRRSECEYRLNALVGFMQTIGHEYTHFLQHQFVKDGWHNFVLDSVGDYTFQGDYFYDQDKKNIFSALKKLSSEKEKNLKALFDDSSFVEALRFLGYASYPYEQDADIGGYIYADLMMNKMIEKVEKVASLDSSLKKDLSSKSLKNLKEIINKKDYNELFAYSRTKGESFVKIIQSFDTKKLISIAESLAILKAPDGSSKALDMKTISELKKFKKLESSTGSAYDKFTNSCELLSKIGTICLDLYGVYAKPEQLSELYLELIERGDPYATYIRDFYVKNHNVDASPMYFNLDKKFFSREKVIELLTSDKVDMSAFSNFNWFGQTDFFDDKEKSQLLCKLIEQKKFDYLTFLMPENLDKEEYKSVKDAIVRAVTEFNEGLENHNSKMLLDDYGNFYHILNNYDTFDKSLVARLEENNKNLKDLKNAASEGQQKTIYYKRYGKKAGDYFFNVWCSDKTSEKEKFDKVVKTTEMLL